VKAKNNGGKRQKRGENPKKAPRVPFLVFEGGNGGGGSNYELTKEGEEQEDSARRGRVLVSRLYEAEKGGTLTPQKKNKGQRFGQKRGDVSREGRGRGRRGKGIAGKKSRREGRKGGPSRGKGTGEGGRGREAEGESVG